MENSNEMIEYLAGMEAPALQDWKNAPKLRDLKQDIEDAKPGHDEQCSQIQEWLDNLNIEGKAKIKPKQGNSSIVPKMIRKQAEWRYASLSEPFLSSDDFFNVRPVSWEDRKAAQQNEILLNHQFNTQIDKTTFIDEYVRTAVDEGTVVVKVGWEFDEEEYEEEVPVVEFRVNPEMVPMHEQLAQLKAESPSQYMTDVPDEVKQSHDLSMQQGQPIEAMVVGYEMQTKTRTLYNRPTLEVCDYRNVVLDPTAKGDMRKARFAGYSFESCLSELRKDPRYKNLDHINIEGNSILGTPDHAVSRDIQSFNFSDTPRKKFVVQEYWGYWDITGDGLVKPIVAAWVGDTMIRLEENPFPDKVVPFVVIQYLPKRKANYGEPDGALLEDNQKVAAAVTRGMIDLMGHSANGQTGMRKDMLDATNRRKFERGLDYEFNAGVDPRQGVFMHTYPEIPQSAQFMLQLQQAEAEAMTGVKSFSNGISGQSLGNVAAGIRGALDASSKRELGILRRLSNGLTQIARKIIGMNAEFLEEEEVIRLTNEEFVRIRRDDLSGNFDLRLTISTAEEDNNKAEQLAFMYQTTAPNGDLELNKMILSDIARLRKMPELAKRIEQYEPQPNPIQQKKAELEVALLEAQVQKTQAEAMRMQSGSQLDMAKAGSENAKATKYQSEADLKNLDFVEQEGGVKQERELQKAGEQARSQAQLKRLGIAAKEQGDSQKFLRDYLLEKEKQKTQVKQSNY